MSTPEFREFAAEKTREAEQAVLPPLITTTPAARPGIGNAWTRRQYDGDFQLFDPPAAPSDVPAMSLVFVQSRGGNTGAANPETIGGGAVDKHLIYEGLSRVAADAVLTGATTAGGAKVFYSVWHPELVALRRDLGLPRHPVQVVVSKEGRIDIDGTLLFNVPDVPVIVIAGAACRAKWHAHFARRPWIVVVPLEPGGLSAGVASLRHHHGLRRISAIGGRATATALIDAGLIQDLCLTTTSLEAGEPNTPFYTGSRPPTYELIAAKRGTDAAQPILFEHLSIRC